MTDAMQFKYVRIQGLDIAENTMCGKGIFSMCWEMIRQDVMTGEDAGLYRKIDGWFAENLPWPPQCMDQESVICWFKTENAEEMLSRITPAMRLLERYDRPFFVVFTNTPGEIVYEDRYQIVTKRDRDVRIDEAQPSWSPQASR